MPIEAEFNCAYCGALNATTVDPSGGHAQVYVEDCQVCCKPNELQVAIDLETETASITAQSMTD